jgi:signal transduction histidine kinase
MAVPELQPPSLPPAPRYPLTQARIETMVSRAIVGFGLVFGVLVLPTLLAQQRQLHQPFAGVQAAALCVCLLWAVGAAALQRGVGAATGSFALLYLLVVVLWPVTAQGSTVDGTSWLWTLCTVASAYASVRMPTWAAAVYVIVAPLLFGIVLWEVSGGEDWRTAVLDAVYAAIMGSVILAIASMLRHAAGIVDVAQKAALDGYERGVREHLGEAERVEVDAFVHDSVLTTLLAAANARTSESKLLAARMAGDALGHLSASKPMQALRATQMTDAWTLVAGIRSASTSIPRQPRFQTQGPLDAVLPSGVAEALHAATVQAMLNSSQHAGGDDVARTVTFTGLGRGGADGMRIRIIDDGVGFDIGQVAPRRLGLATSIIQRVEIVGGEAQVCSAPGAGTTITLSWPAPARGRPGAEAERSGTAPIDAPVESEGRP